MTPPKSLALTTFSLFLGLQAAAGPVPFDSSLEGAPQGFGGTMSYAEARALGLTSGLGTGSDDGAAAARALAAGSSCSVPGASSCAAVSSGNPSGETMLADGSTLVVTASGAQICPAALGPGIAGPPAPCMPCGKECQDRLSQELKKEELAKQKKAAEDEAKRIAEKKALEKKKQDETVAAADEQMFKSKGAGGGNPSTPVNPGDGNPDLISTAYGGGYNSRTSDLATGNGGVTTNGNPAAGNGAVNTSGAINPTLNQALAPSDTIVSGDGQPESISDITDRATSSLVSVLTQLSQGSRPSYGAATVGVAGGHGSASKKPVTGPYKSGKCVNTFTTLCESEGNINAVFNNVLPEMTDSKGDGTVVNPKKGTNNFGAP